MYTYPIALKIIENLNYALRWQTLVNPQRLAVKYARIQTRIHERQSKPNTFGSINDQKPK